VQTRLYSKVKLGGHIWYVVKRIGSDSRQT